MRYDCPNKLICLCIYLLFVLPGCDYGSDDQNSSLPDLETKALTKNSNNNITVMTYNIRRKDDSDKKPNEDDWSTRLPRVNYLISKHNSDIVCLQEASNLQVFQMYSYMHTQYSAYQGKSNNESPEEHCPIFYKKNAFILLDSGSLNVGEIDNKNYNRVCSFVKLKYSATGEVYYVLNTHLSGKGEAYQLDGANDIRHLLGYEGVTTDDGHAGLKLNAEAKIIICGDFNVNNGSSTYNLMIHPDNVYYSYGWELKDSFLSANTNQTDMNTAPGFSFACDDTGNYCSDQSGSTIIGSGDTRIDFIFHSNNQYTIQSIIETENPWINGNKIHRASDHDPVCSEISTTQPVTRAGVISAINNASPGALFNLKSNNVENPLDRFATSKAEAISIANTASFTVLNNFYIAYAPTSQTSGAVPLYQYSYYGDWMFYCTSNPSTDSNIWYLDYCAAEYGLESYTYSTVIGYVFSTSWNGANKIPLYTTGIEQTCGGPVYAGSCIAGYLSPYPL